MKPRTRKDERREPQEPEPEDERAEEGEEAGTELEQAVREREELRAHWQRAQADCQNLRRRHLAELEAGRRRAMQPLLHNLLTVLDHLEMALACPTTTEESRNLAMGVRLTCDQLLSALKEEGVEPLPEEGPFDPTRHEAVETVEESEAEPGTLVRTLRKGYAWGEQVLRAARVVVAAGPEEEESSEDQDPQDELPEEG